MSFSFRSLLPLFFLFVLVFSLQAQIVSDFSIDNEGWTISDASPINFQGTGGNPGGHISFTTPSPAVNLYWVAPAKFTGNMSLSYNQTLSFDLNVSLAGADNSIGDVTLSGPAGTVYYQLPTKPTVNVWNSYSVSINESVWHYGSVVGPIATQNQLKAILASLTTLRIRAKYLSGNTGPYTSLLDNVVLNKLTSAPPPIIVDFAPRTGLPGTTVTINGSNFNPTAAQNHIFFNGVSAAVTSASATQLQVTVPVSAPYGRLTVENATTGLQGISTQTFGPLFNNNEDFGGRIIPSSLARGYYSLLQTGTETASTNNGNGNVGQGDLDGDGWVDLIQTETGTSGTAKIYAFRNLGTGGSVSPASFAPALILSLATIPSGSPNLGELTVADVDSDGKLDVAAVCSSAAGAFLAVFRNTSSTGSLSFSSPLFFGYPYYSSQLTTASTDFDGDGRIDFVYTTGTSPGGIWLNQNLSTPGTVDFSYGIPVGTNLAHTDIAVGDLNSDGKPEIIASTSGTLEVYQNSSLPGTITFQPPFSVTAASSDFIQVTDLDADDKPDLMWGPNASATVHFSKNNYNGPIFNATTFGADFSISANLSGPKGFAVSDINADGKPDVVVSGVYDLGILENVGTTGSLSVSSLLPGVLFQGSATSQPISGSAPVTADLDGDNKPEVMFVYTYLNVPASEKGIYLFHNESFPPPSITGFTPASDGAGATVVLNGNLMFTGNTAPVVRLNKIKSAISGTPTNTIASVTTPSGAITGKFEVTNHGLTGSNSSFKAIFGTTQVINPSSFNTEVDFPLAINTRDALEVADFDDDGKMDVVVIENYSTEKIFQNVMTAGQPIAPSSLLAIPTTFTGGYDAFVMDVDGDGKVDLGNGYGLLKNNSSSSISFLSGPTGTPTNVSGFTAKATADFNKDGKTDIAVVNGGANIQVYENRSTRGTFTSATSSTFSFSAVNLAKPNNYGGVVAVDFDGDGYDDLASANTAANSVTFYANNKVKAPIATTSFTLITSPITLTGSQPYNLTANDFDGDGKIDLAIVYNNSTFISVFRNTSTLGNISFATAVDLPCLTKGYNMASQDLDGDGKPEIVVIHRPNPGPGSFSIFQNKSASGSITFNAAVNYPLSTPGHNPQALGIADINQDEKPDILIVGDPYSTGSNALMVFENKIPSVSITVATQPTPVISVCNGTATAFTTSATGTTNITYQWQIYNTGTSFYDDVVDGGGYSNATTATLNINTSGNFGAGTYRCKISGDFAIPVYANSTSVTLIPSPAAPASANVTNCGSASFLLTATGASGLQQYVWYDENQAVIPGETTGSYTTPVITTSTNFYVAITDGTCESSKTAISATINTIPAAPSVTDASFCGPASLTLTASGGTNGQYRWYTVSTGGTAIAGEVNSTYVTPLLSATTSYFVSINDGCESTRTQVTATIGTGCTTNQPPVISETPISVPVEGIVTLDLTTLVSDSDGNIDLNSLKVVGTPTSGAAASIDANHNLILNYEGIPFSGTDEVTIEVCDLAGACTDQKLSVEVVGDIVIYNAISPNGDGQNDFLMLQYIDILAETKKNKVTILGRWGDVIIEINDYDNKNNVFTGLNSKGNKVPSGTYFYKIEFESGLPTRTGYLIVKQ